MAGWWYRVGATLIDVIIIGVIAAVFTAIGGRAFGYVVDVFIGAAYTIGMLGRNGQTLGCMAVGTRVVAADGSAQLGYGRAAIRWLVQEVLAILLFLPAIVDFLWPLWDRQKQTLHDKAAGTLVVRIR